MPIVYDAAYPHKFGDVYSCQMAETSADVAEGALSDEPDVQVLSQAVHLQAEQGRCEFCRQHLAVVGRAEGAVSARKPDFDGTNIVVVHIVCLGSILLKEFSQV